MANNSIANIQLTKKFVAVLNKRIPIPRLMNALGHMSAGLSVSHSNISEMRFDDYVDKDGGYHKSISDNGFIILEANNSNQIRSLRRECIDKNIHFVDFTDTMTIGTYAEQLERTKNTPEGDLEYFGITMFGEKELLNPLTKKFSLWK